MTPVLYDKTERTFTSLGLGKLKSVIECVVSEERNGMYELEMRYPTDGVLYESIQKDSIILAKPNETARTQPFRVYRISKPINKVVTIYAEHLSYWLNAIPVFPFSAENCPAAVAGMVTNSAAENPFMFTTDKTTQGHFEVDEPVSFRTMLYGVQGSLLDVYGGGDYEFDRFNVYLRNNRGQDNGVVVSYGKNLTDVRQDESIANLVTGVAPFWKGGDGALVTLPERTIQISSVYSYPRIEPLDLSQEFEEPPTIAQLRQAAQSFLNTTDLTTPAVNCTVSFIPLWQTENYKSHPLYSSIAGLERVSLCDTVTVKFLALGVDVTAKVIKTTYDCLAERYNSVDLGKPRSNMGTIVASQQQEIKNKPSVSFLEQAIINATNMITGATGGYVVLDPPNYPQRLLIMDTPDKSTALNVWQWNLNGLGFSSTGIDGPYGTAITADGKIVADYIATGTLNAANISVANLNAGSITTGVLRSVDDSTRFDLNFARLITQRYNSALGKTIYSTYSSIGLLLKVGAIPTSDDYDGAFAVNASGQGSIWVAYAVSRNYVLVDKNITYGGIWLNESNQFVISDGTAAHRAKWTAVSGVGTVLMAQ